MKEQPETRTVVLPLRLGACLTAPTKRLAADLHAASRLYNVCRNAIVWSWEREARCGDGKSFAMHVCRCGAADRRAARKNAGETKVRETCACSGNPYTVGGEAAPLLAAKIVSAACQEVAAKLKTNTPYNHPGKARYVWQAILAHEETRTCYRGSELPVTCQDAKLSLTDSGYTFRFPLWSKASGRKHLSHACRLPSRRLTPGLKRILFAVASGTFKLCDSRLIFHEGKRGKAGWWSIHLCYQRPQEPLGLDVSRVATFQLLAPDAARPFEMSCADSFPRAIGDAAVLEHEYKRLEDRRIGMRARHRDRTSGRRGHGRQRIENAVRPVTRAVRNLMHRFTWRVVAQVVEYCERNNCGTVEYDEPSMKQRAVSWFAKREIPYDWTGLRSRLEHKLWLFGIVLRETWTVRRESGGDGQNTGDRSRNGSGDGVKGNGVQAATNGKKRTAKREALAERAKKTRKTGAKRGGRRNG